MMLWNSPNAGEYAKHFKMGPAQQCDCSGKQTEGRL